ncbi:hypothetical protein GCM10027517_29710 [Phycicoccus ginsengisoli]
MQWTRERRTWLGTSLQKRGRWHGIPYVVHGYRTTGLTRGGAVVLALVALLVVAVVLVEELVL